MPISVRSAIQIIYRLTILSISVFSFIPLNSFNPFNKFNSTIQFIQMTSRDTLPSLIPFRICHSLPPFHFMMQPFPSFYSQHFIPNKLTPQNTIQSVAKKNASTSIDLVYVQKQHPFFAALKSHHSSFPYIHKNSHHISQTNTCIVGRTTKISLALT